MTEQNEPENNTQVLKGKDDTYNPTSVITLEEAESEGFIPATDINAFSNVVVAWHTNIVNQGRHLLSLDTQNPDDPQQVVIQVYEPEHPEADKEGYRAIKNGPELVAFKHGARWLLDLFEDLPFNYVPTDADNNPSPGYAKTVSEPEQE